MRTGTTGKRDRKHGNTVGTRAGSCKRDSGRVPQALPCTRGLRVAPFPSPPPSLGGEAASERPGRSQVSSPAGTSHALPLSRFIFRPGIDRPVNRPAPVPSFRVSVRAHAVTPHTRRHVFPHNDHDTGVAACFNVCRVRNVDEAASAARRGPPREAPSARGRVASRLQLPGKGRQLSEVTSFSFGNAKAKVPTILGARARRHHSKWRRKVGPVTWGASPRRPVPRARPEAPPPAAELSAGIGRRAGGRAPRRGVITSCCGQPLPVAAW